MTKGILPLLGAALVLAACGGDAEEAAVPGADTTAAPAAVAPAGPDTSAVAAAAPSVPGTFLDPNTASAEQLLTVPGFDQATADAVVQGRPYADMAALDSVLSPRLS